jgi:hypothetical protein
MATGTVTVLADGTVYGTATNTFPLVLIPANSLNIGSITITVRYSGDSNCNAVSDSETVSVTDFTQVATPVWLSNSGDVMGPFTAQLFASNPAPAPMIDTMTLYDGTTGLNTATVSGVSAQNLLSPPLVVWPNFCTDDECTDWGMWLDTNTVAPDGSISAYTMELYNEVNIGSVSCTPGQTYQFSVFAQGAGQQIQLQLGSATSDWFSTSANWQEYSVAYTPPDGTAWCTAEIQNSYGSSNSLDIWGPQIQQGTTVGPYIRGYLDGVENSTRTAYAASVPAMLATGAHALTAAFSGDTNGDNYMPGTSEVLHETVTATQPSSVSLQSSTSNPVTTSGTTVGLVANVVPATATGTVSFFNGQTLLAIQPVNNGTAAYSTSTLPVGVDNLVAVYSGDNTFLGSKSAAYTETVETNDTLTLTAATTVRTILPDVLSATVSPSSATGTVEFFSNGNSIGGAPLSNGGAVLLKVFQVPGTYLITAQYSGDSNDSPQTSNTVTVTVIPLF